MVHPLLSSIRNLSYFAIFWLLLTTCEACLGFLNFRLSIPMAIADSVTFNFSYAVLAIGLWYTVRFTSLEKPDVIKRVLHHFVEAIIISGIWILICYFFLRTIFADDEHYQSQLLNTLPIQFGLGLVYYTFTILFYYLVISYRNLQEKINKEAELKTLIKEAELNMLKSQINPHFLFNSLNSISSLTITNPSKAQEMIIKLSEFLRYSIGGKEAEMVSLNKEIEHIMLYLDIEKVRFGERLHFDFQVTEKCQTFPVPNMILQPLIENAIKHGVYESTEEVTISFVCQVIPNGLMIKISNNFDPDAPPRKGNSMGLKNITNRLKLIYQHDDLLKINKKENVFEVEMILPLTYDQSNNN